MGSHYNALLMQNNKSGEHLESLISLLGNNRYYPSGENIYFCDVEYNRDQITVCSLQDCLFIQGDAFFGQGYGEQLDDLLEIISVRTKIFYWCVEDTCGGLGFDFFQDGEKLRSWWEIEGEVTTCHGNPLEAEPEGMFGSNSSDGKTDEWDIINLAENCFGFRWDDLGNGVCSVYNKSEKKELNNEAIFPIKPWWKFW